MAIRTVVFVLVSIKLLLSNSLDGPFKTGFSMGTLGAVTDNFGLLLCRDTLNNNNRIQQWDVSVSYTAFHDAMDNLRDESIYQVDIDATVKSKHMAVYLSASQLNAFTVYYEQKCSGGLDYQFMNLISIGAGVTGHRTGITCYNDNHVSALVNGSLTARVNNVVIRAQVYNIPLKSTKTSGVMPMLLYSCGIQTLENIFGSQAFRLEIRPDLEMKVRWILGDELTMGKRLTVQFAIANNPLQVSFGLQMKIKSLISSIAVVNNERLGWSKGVGFGWFSDVR